MGMNRSQGKVGCLPGRERKGFQRDAKAMEEEIMKMHQKMHLEVFRCPASLLSLIRNMMSYSLWLFCFHMDSLCSAIPNARSVFI